MANARRVAPVPPAPNATPPKRDEKDRLRVMELIDKAKPDVFAAVLAGKIDAGTVTATTFNLIDPESRRLATLGTTTSGDAGLALFRPGSERAVAELVLAEGGPALRLNDAKGRERLRLAVHHGDGPGASASVALLDEHGKPRVVFLVDQGRPHVITFPRGSRRRHVVASAPLGSTGEPRAWARAMRAARANKRAAFDAAALDAGFLSPDVSKLWDFTRGRLKRRATGKRVTTSSRRAPAGRLAIARGGAR